MTKDGELNIEDEILEGNKTKNGEGTKKSAFWKRNFLSRKKKNPVKKRKHSTSSMCTWLCECTRGVLFINKFCFPSNSEIKRTTVACAHVYVCECVRYSDSSDHSIIFQHNS